MGNQVTPQADTLRRFPTNPNDTVSSMTVITTRHDRRDTYTEPLPIPKPVSKLAPSVMPKTSEIPSPPDALVLNHSKRRKSSLLNVQNGVTGTFLSGRICKIAAKFWKKNIETLSVADQLELGCSIFFHMMSTNYEMRKLMKSNISSGQSIETTSIKYLDMFGWLIRYLVRDKIDLFSLLDRLGTVHRKMGITLKHFEVMLQAMHECFAYYFESIYNIDVKYALDEIFSFAAQVMTGQNLRCSSRLKDINEQFEKDHIPFLENLDACLESPIGTEYLYRFLSQTWCDEMVIFLQSFKRFKRAMTDKERFFIARGITKHSIDPTAAFSLNLSYENRINTLHKMRELETQFALKGMFKVSSSFYDDILDEIRKLISDNHWVTFVADIEALQVKSFGSQ